MPSSPPKPRFADPVSVTPVTDPPAPDAPTSVDVVADVSETILIYMVEDGLSTNGRVWYKGQELEFVVGSAQYADTQDRHGRSWLDYDDREQMARWGRVLFRRGPWPGSVYAEEAVEEAERLRSRTPPVLQPLPAAPSVLPPGPP